MAEKKITKREMFENLKTLVADNEEMVAFIDHELELLAKKNSADKKPTKTQEANVAVKEAILNVMTTDGKTATEIVKALGTDITNQKVSALLRQLVADGTVVRIEDKRKTYFALPSTEIVED